MKRTPHDGFTVHLCSAVPSSVFLPRFQGHSPLLLSGFPLHQYLLFLSTGQRNTSYLLMFLCSAFVSYSPTLLSKTNRSASIHSLPRLFSFLLLKRTAIFAPSCSALLRSFFCTLIVHFLQRGGPWAREHAFLQRAHSLPFLSSVIAIFLVLICSLCSAPLFFLRTLPSLYRPNNYILASFFSYSPLVEFAPGSSYSRVIFLILTGKAMQGPH